MNLNEINIPPDADEPTDWAVRREFGLRYDSYREATLWGVVEYEHPEMRKARESYRCQNPEAQWIADMQHSVHWERCVP